MHRILGLKSLMKIYIAGKITGLAETEAYERFLGAENLLMHCGHTPLNPMRMVDQTPGREYGEYLADALQIMLTQAEAVYFLDNAIESRGARIECYIATELEMPMFYEGQDIPLGCDWPEPKER